MKILYFVKGCVPTAKQMAEADGMNALIRNASISSGDFIEHCDAVAGDVPEAYAKFPREFPGRAINEPNAGKGQGVQIKDEMSLAAKDEAAKKPKDKSPFRDETPPAV